MNAAIIKTISPSGVESYVHVSPYDRDTVLWAASGNGFRVEHIGYEVCPVEDHDGRCACFDGDDG